MPMARRSARSNSELSRSRCGSTDVVSESESRSTGKRRRKMSASRREASVKPRGAKQSRGSGQRKSESTAEARHMRPRDDSDDSGSEQNQNASDDQAKTEKRKSSRKSASARSDTPRRSSGSARRRRSNTNTSPGKSGANTSEKDKNDKAIAQHRINIRPRQTHSRLELTPKSLLIFVSCMMCCTMTQYCFDKSWSNETLDVTSETLNRDNVNTQVKLQAQASVNETQKKSDIPTHFFNYYGAPDAEFDWCEGNYERTFFGVIPVAEYWNTITSFWYFFPPLLGYYFHGSRAKNAIDLSPNGKVNLLCVLMITFGTIAFHLTLRYWAQIVDELPIYYVILSGSFCVWKVRRRMSIVKAYEEKSQSAQESDPNGNPVFWLQKKTDDKNSPADKSQSLPQALAHQLSREAKFAKIIFSWSMFISVMLYVTLLGFSRLHMAHQGVRVIMTGSYSILFALLFGGIAGALQETKGMMTKMTRNSAEDGGSGSSGSKRKNSARRKSNDEKVENNRTDADAEMFHVFGRVNDVFTVGFVQFVLAIFCWVADNGFCAQIQNLSIRLPKIMVTCYQFWYTASLKFWGNLIQHAGSSEEVDQPMSDIFNPDSGALEFVGVALPHPQLHSGWHVFSMLGLYFIFVVLEYLDQISQLLLRHHGVGEHGGYRSAEEKDGEEGKNQGHESEEGKNQGGDSETLQEIRSFYVDWKLLGLVPVVVKEGRERRRE